MGNPIQVAGDGGGSAFDRMWETVRELECLITHELATDSVDLSPVVGRLRDLTNACTEAQRSHHPAFPPADKLLPTDVTSAASSGAVTQELAHRQPAGTEVCPLADQQRDNRLRFLGGLFENAQEGVVALDANACIVEANPVFQAISRREEEDVVGRPLATVVEWAFPQFEDVLQSVISGRAWTGRVVIACGDRDERAFLVSFSPVQSDGQSASVVVIFSDVTQIDRTQRRLKRQALHDQLTGLPNRRFFRERIKSLIEDCRRERSAFAVCFIDLDNFKHVNDTLGHSAGDDLLIKVARRLREQAGPAGFVARFGGDEFAVLIPHIETDLRKTALVTDRILQALRTPISVSDAEACIGASIGVTQYPAHSRNLDELLQNADVAMYAAKKRGRNQICVFTPEMRDEVQRRNLVLSELQRALRGNEISLHYQPQVDLTTGRLVGCEALARWRTPDGRDISPGEFVPVAERSGLVVPLGELVLMTACRQVVEWDALGCRPPHVAVNISPQHLHERNFVERVTEILDATQATPEWIRLEITENAVIDDVQHAMRTMDRLVALGLTLALDDFGTGYSSLSHLKQFNIHTLKMDRSFVADLPGDGAAQTMVESIIHLGRGRGLSVVAEGIETQAQYDLLRQLGCHVGQGYHIAHPLRPVEFESWWDAVCV